MEYLIDKDTISIEYSVEKELNGDAPYRVTLYDRYGHYDKEFFMTKEQMDDLIDGVKNMQN
jgi:hypothetical protein